jgi:hypothetical protein
VKVRYQTKGITGRGNRERQLATHLRQTGGSRRMAQMAARAAIEQLRSSNFDAF